MPGMCNGLLLKARDLFRLQVRQDGHGKGAGLVILALKIFFRQGDGLLHAGAEVGNEIAGHFVAGLPLQLGR